jgi:hypothetical protein
VCFLRLVDGQLESASGKEKRTGGYNEFLTAVVNKKFIEDHFKWNT